MGKSMKAATIHNVVTLTSSMVYIVPSFKSSVKPIPQPIIQPSI